MAKDILSYGIGTLAALAIVVGLAFLFISDITQKYLRVANYANNMNREIDPIASPRRG